MDRFYGNLADAIIVQAARDYRWALKRLKKRPHDLYALKMKEETLRFFRSIWYEKLTEVPVGLILDRLDEEIGK